MNTPNARKAAARRYQRAHPGTPYPEALRAVTADLVVHLPDQDDNATTAALRDITRALQAHLSAHPPADYTAEILAGNWPPPEPDVIGLGGIDGYGEHWTNATFTMRPYYYGDCTCGQADLIEQWSDANPHAPECTQTTIAQLQIRYSGKEFDAHFEQLKNQLAIPDDGAMWHCTCGIEATYQHLKEQHSPTCEQFAPNFVYHSTGAEIRWYKWIGRDMEITGDLPDDFGTQCLRSLGLRR
ncbi:hypothetical protein QRB41_12975 [Mycobacterium avium subsp. hominissuis]|uniref:hypothetical protein n=1 Tax=Mycobacterium avium TaxID=1764 RepID=UPI001140BE11|nr:hypothetical protein [Mycobacterium avium]MDO2384311.1 hypothetical protein [Mycobacterium avium subsp. hominissuis]MDO2395317.1 hypothetical protein [Mycobacterium avium subsp. hominissuis]